MTIRDYTEEAVRKYLRTVLLVDDRLFSSKSKNAVGQEDGGALDLFGIPNTLESGITSSDDERARCEQSEKASQNLLDEDPSHNLLDDELSPKPLDKTPSPSTEPFSPQKVIEGFYRQGIVCGLYEPKASEFSNGTVPSSLVDLCDHSDVFILDWKLMDNQNASPVPGLLAQLLERDDSMGEPRAVRFCAIYTDELLGTVFDKLHSEIFNKSSDDSKKEDLQSFQMSLNGLTIRLYRKNSGFEADGSPTRFVSSPDLAETIVQDFIAEYEGIMSATSLRGIAEVRDNAKRILDKFPKGMDAALVLHAGLTLKEKSIVSDLATLLGDETSSILADMNLSAEHLYEMCAEYVESCDDTVFDTTGDPNLDSVFSGHVTGASVQQYITNVYRQQTHFPCNPDGKTLPEIFKKCKNGQGEFDPNVNLLHLLKTFVERKTKESKDYDFGALSALFCQRTNYAKRKTLRFGTIVGCHEQEGQNTDYYLCLMPTCDSIRLKDQITDDAGNTHQARHRFPFWKLDEVSKGGEHRTHGVYVKAQGTYFPLCAKGKIRDKIHIIDFHSQGGLVCFDESGILTCVDGSMNFEWIAELKPAHMQRIAERVSREFSRVGLTESEWLRKQVDR